MDDKTVKDKTIFEKLFDKIPFPIIVWRLEDSNNNMINIYKNGMDETIQNIDKINIDNYISRFKEKNRIKYKDFIFTKQKSEIDTCSVNIVLDFIDDSTFFELHHPKCGTEYILSSISYKMRNPLTNIVGILPVVQNYNKDDKTFQNYISIIKQSSSDIISLANDVIDILNIQQNKVIVKKERILLDNLINNCFKIVNGLAVKKKLSLFSNIDNDVPKVVYSDKDKLKQLIVNLLSNGIRFTSVGGITLSVSLSRPEDNDIFPYLDVDEPKYNILFKIKDSGIGINNEKKEILENIMGIKKTGGLKTNKLTGFGLYISAGLCNLLGGNMWFKSEEDIGSVFYFNIICETDF